MIKFWKGPEFTGRSGQYNAFFLSIQGVFFTNIKINSDLFYLCNA